MLVNNRLLWLACIQLVRSRGIFEEAIVKSCSHSGEESSAAGTGAGMCSYEHRRERRKEAARRLFLDFVNFFPDRIRLMIRYSLHVDMGQKSDTKGAEAEKAKAEAMAGEAPGQT
jgi:hypothetical protein